jgi:hypothetical protein
MEETAADVRLKFVQKANLGKVLAYNLYTYELDLHKKGDLVPVWIFVTEGMGTVKQPELVFILKMNSEEIKAEDKKKVIPPVPIIFTAFYTGASVSNLNIIEGYTHKTGDRGFLKPEFKGVVFQQLNLEYIPNGILKDEENYLSIITLYDTELHIATTCSPTRVLASLGRREKIFPYPIFCDRDREPVYPTPNTHSDSILLTAPHINIPEISSVLMDNDNKVVIKIPKYTAEILKKELDTISPDSVVIIPTHISENEDAHICWNPSQNAEVERSQLEVFVAPHSKGTKIGGSFIGFVPEQKQDEAIIYEDGFLLMLSDGSWGLLRKCLGRAANCYVQSDTEKGLHAEISFFGESAPEEKKELQNQVMVLTPKEDLVKRIDTESFATYTESIITSLSDHISIEKPGFENIKQTILQFDLNPTKPLELKIACRPATIVLSNSVKQEIGAIVKQIQSPTVTGTIQFQIYFTPKELIKK